MTDIPDLDDDWADVAFLRSQVPRTMVQEVQRTFRVLGSVFVIINLLFVQYLLGAGVDGGAQIFVFIFSVRYHHFIFFPSINIFFSSRSVEQVVEPPPSQPGPSTRQGMPITAR